MTIEAIKASVDAFTIKTTETITAITAKTDAVQAEVDRIAAVLKRPGFGGGAANDNEPNAALRTEREAVALFARTGDDSKLKAIQAGMQTGSDPDGGYSVLPTYSTSMTKKLFDQSPIRRLARTETITQGDSFVEPIDNGETEAVWVGETQSRPETDNPTLGMLTVPAHEIYSNTPVTQRLLEDAGFDLGSYIENKTTDKFARSEGSAFVTGNGVGKPRGFLDYDTATTSDATRAWKTVQHVISGAATSVTADGIKNLTWALRAPYRQGASFVMNSQSANAIDKIKDGNGNYIWRTSMTSGAPNELLGYPVEFDEDMPDLEAGSLSIAFANWKLAYLIVDRIGVRFLRDPFTAKPHVLFYAYKRMGGGIANSQAIKLLKTAAA